MRNPTPAEVQAFWAYMTGKYGSQVKAKAEAPEMQVVADLLERLGVVPKQDFLTRFVTTLGKVIYVPFAVGDESTGWSLWEQIEVAAHEHQHVVQAARLGEIEFSTRYLLQPTYRATFEGEAYRVSVTLEWWHRKALPPIEQYVEFMRSYGIGTEVLAYFEKYLRLSYSAIEQGALADEAGKVAIEWLNANLPALRA